MELVVARDTSEADRLVAEFLVSCRTDNTRTNYARDIRFAREWYRQFDLDLLDLRRKHIDAYRIHLEQHRSRPTVARRLSALASFYRYVLQEYDEIITSSPVAHAVRPQVANESASMGLELAAARRLLLAAEQSSDQHYLLVALMLLNGLRVSEAASRRREDFVEEAGHWVVRYPRKGGVRAQSALDFRLHSAVRRLLEAAEPGAHMFTTVRGLPMNRASARLLVKKLAQDARITGRVHPHALRHTFVTQCHEAGVSLVEIQRAVGHSDPKTTLRYEHTRARLDRDPTYRLAAHLWGSTAAP